MSKTTPGKAPSHHEAWARTARCVKNPDIVQCGLARHGYRPKEQFIQRECCSFHFYHYAGSLIHRGKPYAFDRNWVSLIPASQAVSWVFPEEANHYYVHFLNEQPLPCQTPLVMDTEAWGGRVQSDLQFILAQHGRESPAASVRLWDLIWQLTIPPHQRAPAESQPSAVQIAKSLIRNSLDIPIRTHDLAYACGISPGHLNRLFRASTQMSVQEYIQRTRADQARQLLVDSDLPVRAIAHMVGFTDLQAFNKFIRKRLDASPRKYRERHGTRN